MVCVCIQVIHCERVSIPFSAWSQIIQYSLDKNFRQIHRPDTGEGLRRVEQIQVEWQLMVLSLDLVLSI